MNGLSLFGNRLLVLLVLAATVACTHPIEITGSGDISATGNGSSCALEDAPCATVVVNDYLATYTAAPREGYGFLGWEGCPSPQGVQCAFNIPAAIIHQFWFQTASPLRVNFSPLVELGNLSGDFSPSVDCEGHVFSNNPEVVFRYRESTTAVGEKQKQCIGNAIFWHSQTNTNYLVWVDILHIDGNNQPIYDDVNGKLPIREIFATYGPSLIVGKPYVLQGTLFTPNITTTSIQITWIDIDAEFGEFSNCTILESQTPLGAPTYRKTYCPRLDGSLEIKQSLLL